MTLAGAAVRSGLIGVALLMQVAAVRGQGMEVDGIRREFRTCHADADNEKRLACYDALQRILEPPNFQGAHSQETPFFTIDRPTLLRYQSDGPIFVMYLQDEKGNVVQNLHIGGGGESSFLITTRGKYNLDVNGTDNLAHLARAAGCE